MDLVYVLPYSTDMTVNGYTTVISMTIKRTSRCWFCMVHHPLGYVLGLYCSGRLHPTSIMELEEIIWRQLVMDGFETNECDNVGFVEGSW
jgi:hypothetical protein